MTDFSVAYPNSRKVYEERSVSLGPNASATLRVPMREVSLRQDTSAIRLYDTSGPQGCDVREGLPKLRAEWVEARRRTGTVGTQLFYARRGEVTPEMEYVATREGLPVDFVRAEIAKGGTVDDAAIERAVERVFDFRPAAIIDALKLRRPIYRHTAAYGHFGRHDLDLPWERLDRVEALKAAIGI